MSDRIDPAVIKAAALALAALDIQEREGRTEARAFSFAAKAEAAIRAADEARGLMVEEELRHIPHSGPTPVAVPTGRRRYISEWRPVEHPTAQNIDREEGR